MGSGSTRGSTLFADFVPFGRVVKVWTAMLAWVGLGVALPGLALAAASKSETPPVGVVHPAPIFGLKGARSDRPDPVSHRRLAAPAAAAAAASIPSGTWQPLGPAAIGPSFLAGGGSIGGVSSGRITSVVDIPAGSHSGRIVAGSAGGGIWTSDDGGGSWTPRSDFAANLAIGSLTIDPSNPDHLIAGTGEGNECGDCYAGSGILVSTDGGTTWTLQNPGGVLTDSWIERVAIDPSDSNHQFAATNHGLYVTTDGGSSWAKPTDPSYASVDGYMTAVIV
jgi:hypothetical protein